MGVRKELEREKKLQDCRMQILERIGQKAIEFEAMAKDWGLNTKARINTSPGLSLGIYLPGDEERDGLWSRHIYLCFKIKDDAILLSVFATCAYVTLFSSERSYGVGDDIRDPRIHRIVKDALLWLKGRCTLEELKGNVAPDAEDEQEDDV